MVKKFIYSVLALIAFTSATNVSAQEQTMVDNNAKHELQFGVGVGALPYEKADYGAYAKDLVVDNECMAYINVNAQYMYNFNNRFALGGKLSSGAGAHQIESNDKEIGSLAHFDASAMLVGRCYWIHKDHFGLYSKMGVGAEAYYNEVELKDGYKKDNKIANDDLKGDKGIHFTAEAAPVGVDFGGKRVKAFIEPTLGRNFSLNAGVKFNF